MSTADTSGGDEVLLNKIISFLVICLFTRMSCPHVLQCLTLRRKRLIIIIDLKQMHMYTRSPATTYSNYEDYFCISSSEGILSFEAIHYLCAFMLIRAGMGTVSKDMFRKGKMTRFASDDMEKASWSNPAIKWRRKMEY